MATYLLISCGRTAVLKTFKLQAWGLRSVPPAVSLCTKRGDDKKVFKKKSSDAAPRKKRESGSDAAPRKKRESEAEPPVETAPETFDMSTYKNLQHHDYTPFTFVDYDVQLAKFRLPQPSSGRVSPRH